MESKMIVSEHHRGKKVPLWVVLGDLAAQEGCDGSPYDEMQIASDHIRELEEELNPYREMERNIFEKIRKLEKKEKEEDERFLEPLKEAPALEVGPNSHVNQPELPGESHNGCCIICGRDQTMPHHATRTEQCCYCGQRYWKF